MKKPTSTTVIKTPFPTLPEGVNIGAAQAILGAAQDALYHIPLPDGGSLHIQQLIVSSNGEDQRIATQIHYFAP